MALEHQSFTFAATDMGGVADEMERFAQDADDRRWVNIVPDVDEGEVHTGSVFWRIFSSRGAVIPKLTWVPAHQVDARIQLAQVGLAHATGDKALERLARAGIAVPSGWTSTQDHQKRGLIFDLEAANPSQELTSQQMRILKFATRAIPTLSPFAFEGYYTATFSTRS